MPLRRIFLHPSDLTFKLLRESTWYFGNNPRQCLEASSSVANLKAKKSKVESAIRRGMRNKSYNDLMPMLQSTRTGAPDVAYMIFLITPGEADKKQLLSDCHYTSISKWSTSLLLDLAEETAAAPYKQLMERAYAQYPGRSHKNRLI